MFRILRLLSIFVFISIHSHVIIAADYFWVGGSGSWNDLTHWATTSGGGTNHTIVPSVLDNVIFDANSFPAGSQSVTLNQEAFCKDFKWDNVSNNPSFVGAGYNLNVANDFIVLGTPFTYNHINGNLTIGGDFLVDGSNMSFTKNSGTMTIGGQFDIMNVSTMSFSRSGAISISGGPMTFTDAVLTSFTSSSISITTGDLSFINSKTTGNFSGGALVLNNGAVTIPNWSGGNFTTSSMSITGNLSVTNWTSGNLTTGNVTSSTGKILIEDWNAGSISMGVVQLSSPANVGGFQFINSTMTSFSSSNITIVNGNLSFTNSKTTGTFSTSIINLNNGGISIPVWTGGNFSTSNINLTGDFTISNWSSGTLSCGTISSTNGKVVIDNKTSGNTSMAFNLANGAFELKNSSGFTFTFSNSSTVGSLLVDNSPLPMQFASTYSLTCNGDFSILNGATTYTHNSTLSVRGNFTLNNACTFNQSNYVIFTATTTGKTITSAGKSFTNVRFSGSGGEWILQDHFKVNSVSEHYSGIFRSNGKNVDYGVSFDGDSGGSVKIIDYTGTDTVRVQYNYRLNTSASTVLTIGDAVLLMRTSVSTNLTLEGGGKTFNNIEIQQQNGSTSTNVIYIYDNNNVFGDVNISINNRSYVYIVNTNNTFGDVNINYNGTASVLLSECLIYGAHSFGNFMMTTAGHLPRLYCDQNNTFDTVSLPPGSQWRIYQTRVQSLKGLIANGNCLNIINIISSSATVSATITDIDGGTNTLDYVKLDRINFSGAGVDWFATNTLDAANTTGITVTEPASKTFYWIGGAGNWNDPTKWSLTSGGAPANCLITRIDHVVFDNNSFPGSNQTVTLNVAVEIQSMTWTSGINASPNFSGSQSLILNGDLNIAGAMDWIISGALTLRESIVLNAGVNWSQTGNVFFSGTISGHIIDMAGKIFSSYVYFDNPGNSSAGSWTLASNFNVSPSYYTIFRDAEFISDGYSVDFGIQFSATDNVPKILNFTGTDTVRVQYVWNMLSGANADLTMGNAVLLIRQPSNLTNTITFNGGGKTYHDLVIDALHTTSPYSINLSGTGTVCRDIYISIYGNENANWSQSFTSRDVYVNYLNSFTYSPNFQVSENHVMKSLRFKSPIVRPRLYLYNNNTIDTLELYHGMYAYFGANQTQTLKSLIANGNCLRPLVLYSTSSGSQAILNDDSGTNTVDFVYMKDLNAQGGASWIVNNLFDDGNNTGWTLNPLAGQTFYWIGGAGNWDDPTKWSLTSGGSPGSCIPSRVDDVVFDNNSFPGSNQTVVLNVSAEVVNMTWTSGINASPNFSGNQTLIINGDLNVAGSMDWIINGTLTLRESIILNAGANWSQTGAVFFSGTTSGHIINMAGKIFSSYVYFDNPGNTSAGSWTLASNFTVSTSYYTLFRDAEFISNGYSVNFGSQLSASDNVPKILNFTGSDTVRVQYVWSMLNGANANLTMGNAVLLLRQPSGLTNTITFNGAGKTYSDVVIDAQHTTSNYTITLTNTSTVCRDVYINISGQQAVNWAQAFTSRDVYVKYFNANTGYVPNFQVSGNHVMKSLRFNTPNVQPRLYLYNNNSIDTLQIYHGMDVYFGANQTQTLQAFIANGICTRLIDLFSTSTGTQAILADGSGNNSIDFINFRDIRAQGGATWDASNVLSNINNTGWNIVIAPSITYYWIGGTGNWNDISHWSLTSGGGSAGCIPNNQDNIVFDVNSFSATGQSVNLVGTVICRNMTWTNGVTLNPNFQGNYQLEIQGDLKVSGTMSWYQNANLILRGDFILSNSTTWNHSANVYFYSDSTNNQLNTAGKTMLQYIYFDAMTTSSGPKWTLGSDLNVNTSYSINLVEGSFISNGFEINSGYEFLANSGSDTRVIDLTGTDTLRVRANFRMTTSTNTTFIHGGATILFQSSINDHFVFDGGNKTYQDLAFRQHGLTSTILNLNINGNNIIGNVYFQTPTNNAYQRRINFNNSSTFGNFKADYLGSSQLQLYFTTGPHNFNNFIVETPGNGIVYLDLNSNNTFNTLDLPNGFDMLIQTSRTQTCSNFIPRSTCLKRSTIRGSNSTTSRILQASGTVETEWITLQNHTVLGGATFNATNVSLVGTVTGWNYITVQPITMYWVGGTGNWSDPNKWSFTSGGVGNGCIIPKSTDDVVFDAASFTAGGQTVTLNLSATVANMIWNNVAFTPNFTGVQSLTINGELFINSAMSWNQSGTLNLNGSVTFASAMNWNRTATTNFAPIAGNYTLDFGGKVFNGATLFVGSTNATWTLLNDFISATGVTVNFQQGKFYTNGYDVDFGYTFNSNYTNSRLLDFSGTDTIRIRREWYINSTNLNFNLGNAVILLQTTLQEDQYFRGGNISYGDLIIRGLNANNATIYMQGNNSLANVQLDIVNRKDINLSGNSTFESFNLNLDHINTGSIPLFQITGTNVFNTFVILSKGIQGPEIQITQNNTFGSFISVGRNTRLKFGANRTQTFTGDVQILGTGSTPIIVNSTSTGVQATLFKASGELCFDYVWIQDINATGGATYNAGLNGIDLGNNNGITFGNSCIAYYWVGDSGNWSDYANHWATASGGSVFYLQPPLPTDHVVFDANSFTTSGQTVTLDVVGTCLNMTWLSVLYNPTFTGPVANLDIHGDLTLSPVLIQNFTGSWNFKATDGATHNVNTYGKSLTDMSIQTTNSSTIQLSGNLITTNSINVVSGNFHTNGKSISTKDFNFIGNALRSCNLGSSEISITNGKWDVQDPMDLTITPAASKILLKSEGGSSDFFGGGKTYNEVRFRTATTMNGLLTGSNSYEKLTVDPGTTLTLESGSTQTSTLIDASGICDKDLTIQSTTNGTPATLSQASGTVNSNFINLKDNTATGGATFNANQANDLGGNTGWNFPSFNLLAVSINAMNPTCPTPNNGSVTAVPSGGVGPFSYKWNTLSTLATLNNLSQGSYSVTVTDASGCTGTATAMLTQPASYNFSTTTTGETICFGAMNGDVSVNAPDALPPLNYTWSNGGNTQMIGGLGTGTYSVTVVDAANCRAINSATVNSFSDINASASITSSKCINAPVSFSANGTGGVLTYNWNFDDGNTGSGQSISHTYTTADDYNVKVIVTNDNGCQDSAVVMLAITPELQLSANVIDVTSCNPNTCNGQVILMPDEGLAPFQFFKEDFAHDFAGTNISPTIFTKDNNAGSYSQNDQLSVTGNGSWNKRIYTNATHPRVVGKEFYFKYYHPAGGLSMVGWHGNSTSNTSNTYIDLIYAFYFNNTNLQIYQDGSNYGTFTGSVPGGFTTNTWYELKIVLKATGADYYIRKLNTGNFVLLYSGTFSSETNLRLGMCVNSGTFITDDWIITSANAATTGLCVGDHHYFVIDDNGCRADHVSTVDINDLTAPNALCKNITVSLDANGSYTLDPAEINNNSTDDCGIDQLNADPTSFDCSHIGLNSVELLVTDLSGNTSSCLSSVTIKDLSPPVLTCPLSIDTINVMPGSPCTIMIPDYISLLNPEDNCSASSNILEDQDVPAGSYAVTGNGQMVVVNYTATDEASPANTKTCTVNIIVSASEMEIQGNNTAIADGDMTPSPTDHTDFGQSTGAPLTRTFTIYNTGGLNLHLDANAFNITGPDAAYFMVDNVNLPADISGPNGSLNFDVVYTPLATGIHSATIEITNSNCEIPLYDFAVQGEMNCSPPAYSSCPAAAIIVSTDAGQCDAIVNYSVVATGTPVPTLTYEFSGATTDNGSGTGTGSTFAKGTTSVAVTATNTCGSPTCVFNVVVNDNENPVPVCEGPQTIALNADCELQVPDLTNDPTATDNCSSAFTWSQSTPIFTLISSGEGMTHTITVTVDDGNGNSADCTVVLTGDDNTDPTPVCEDPQIILLSADCELMVPDLTNGASAMDNCSSAFTWSQSTSSGTLISSGEGTTHTITVTVDDGNGNSADCTVVLTGDDNTDPVPVCEGPQTIVLNADCELQVPDLTNGATATDNCSSAFSWSQSTTSGTLISSGEGMTHTITVTVDDGNGNSADCTVVLTGEDNTDPVPVCEGPQTIALNANCELQVPDLTNDPTATDNCSSAFTWSQSTPIFTLISSGEGMTHTITVTVDDGNGNSADCTVVLTGDDNTDPTPVCEDPQIILLSADCELMVPDLTNGASAMDNCSAAFTWSQSTSSGTLISSGEGTTHTITVTVDDGNGNSADCTVVLTGDDNTDPVPVCEGPQTIALNANCELQVPDLTNDPTATDNCSSAFTWSQSTPIFTLISSGEGMTHTITVTVDDGNGNSADCTVVLTGDDNTDPVPVCEGPQTITLNSDCELMVPDLTNGATATDNCSSSFSWNQSTTSGTLISSGEGMTHTITVTVDDGNGNSADCTVVLTGDDNTDPVPVCEGPQTIALNADCELMVPDLTNGATATDNCSSAFSWSQSTTSGTLISSGEGMTHTITVTVDDGNGNSADCTVVLTGEDNTDPVPVCEGPQTIALNANCELQVPDLTNDPTATDNCSSAFTWSQSTPIFTLISSGEGMTHTITVTVDDGNGNSADCTVVLTGDDNTEPVPVCEGPQTVALNADCELQVPDLTNGATATDNCSSAFTWSQSTASGTMISSGEGTMHTITVTVDDGNGNSADCTVVLTGDDNTDPVPVCEGPQTIALNADCELMVPDLTNGATATDNCSSTFTWSQSTSSGTLISSGEGMTHTITVTVDDGNGNSADCTVVLTGDDNTEPVPVCEGPQTVALNADCELQVPDLTNGATATDNCSSAFTWSQSTSSGTLISSGEGTTHTITVTVDDGNGNSADCTVVLTGDDNTDPVPVCEGPQTIVLDIACKVLVPDLTDGATATDNCAISFNWNQSPVQGTLLSSGDGITHTITVSVDDGNGNSADCTVILTGDDTTAPSVNCPQNAIRNTNPGICSYQITGAEFDPTEGDNCGLLYSAYELSGATNGSAANSLSGVVLELGTTTVVWTIVDESENETQCSFTVQVKDTEAPGITCPDDITATTQTNQCTMQASEITLGSPAVSDNCAIKYPLTNNSPNVYGLGNTNVKWIVKDSSNNKSNCTQKVTVLPYYCGQPIQIYHTDTTQTTAKIKWKAGICPTDYQLRIRQQLAPGVWGSWSSWVSYSGTGLQHLFTNLDPDTYHHYQIKTKCGIVNSIIVNGWFWTLGGGALKGNHNGSITEEWFLENNADHYTNGEFNSELKMELIPNPASDWTRILLNGFNHGTKDLSMMDLNGKLVMKVTIPVKENSIELDLRAINLRSGMYYIRINDGARQIIKPLIVEP